MASGVRLSEGTDILSTVDTPHMLMVAGVGEPRLESWAEGDDHLEFIPQ